jgi:hypothetical protein
LGGYVNRVRFGFGLSRSRRPSFVTIVTVLAIGAGAVGCAHNGGSPGRIRPVVVTKATQAPRLRDVRILSRTYRLSPAGKLARPQTVRLPLTRRVPPGWAVVIATAETSQGPWTYLPARLSPDRRTAIFTTTHHSIFTVIGEDVHDLLRFFRTEFLDGLSSGATASATRPQCAGQSAARSGYDLASSSGSTVFWCFGTDSSGQRILRIVDNRPYPLEIQHSGLSVAERPAMDLGSLPSLSHFLSGKLSILPPGGQIGYRVNLAAGQSASAETAVDGFGESLMALQTGLNTMLAILTRFGAGGASKSVTALNDALGDVACADAVHAANPGSILSSCLSPKDLFHYFGAAGLLLAPLAAAGGLASFFTSEFTELHDVWFNEDRYDILVRHQAAVPVLGQVAGLFAHGQGWGQVRPATVFNGGDPTGMVSHIAWSSWGGSTAVGTGVSDYVGPNQTVAGGTEEAVTIVAFDLGTCDGKLMYQAVEWYFPQHHETFNLRRYEDVCHGRYVGE